MITIREYEGCDKEGIIRMILKIQQEEYHLPITAEDQPDLADIEGFYRANDGNFWVAVEEGEIIGTIAMKNIGEGKAVLRKMFVRDDRRGKHTGVSLDLLSILIRWARQKGFKKIYLGTTLQFLAAHRFYEKNGFQEIDQEDLPANFPIMAVDKKFYTYSL